MCPSNARGVPSRRVIDTPPRNGVRLRLFCFPYAGGSPYVFRSWQAAFPAEVDVCPVHLPGRGGRFAEPSHTRLDSLLDDLAADLHDFLALPYVFFGHSLGAIIAYELARRFERAGTPPAALIAAGRQAPHHPHVGPYRHRLRDEELLDSLRALNGTPEVIATDAAVMEVMLPILRADISISETYVHDPGPPLTCPISAYGGLQDADVGREKLLGWRSHTRAAFRLQLFPGGHFFLRECEGAVVRAVIGELLPILAVQSRVDVPPLRIVSPART